MIKVFSLTSPEIVVHLPPLRVTVDPGAFNVTLTSLPSAFLFVTVIGADELDVTVDPSTNIALIAVDFVVSEVITTFWTVALFETVNEASCNVTVSYVPLLRVTYGVEPSAGALTVKLVDFVPVLLIVMFFADVKFKVELVSNSAVTVVFLVVSGTVILSTTPSSNVTLFEFPSSIVIELSSFLPKEILLNFLLVHF